MAIEVFTWYMICCSLFQIHGAIISTDDSSLFFKNGIFRCWYLGSGRVVEISSIGLLYEM